MECLLATERASTTERRICSWVSRSDHSWERLSFHCEVDQRCLFESERVEVHGHGFRRLRRDQERADEPETNHDPCHYSESCASHRHLLPSESSAIPLLQP